MKSIGFGSPIGPKQNHARLLCHWDNCIASKVLEGRERNSKMKNENGNGGRDEQLKTSYLGDVRKRSH